MWKQRYFTEKKKMPPLDEHVTQLKSELEQLHTKTVQTMESEAKHAFQMGYGKESDIGVNAHLVIIDKIQFSSFYFVFFILENFL
jgi:hypothetical protein